jgi:FtsP/CotA-like multicopper oxidase with cupredoxin domain
MHSRLFTHLRSGLLALLAMLIVAALPASIARGAIAITNTNSDAAMVCVEDSANTFHFVTTDGYISIPDGNTVYMWGYALDADNDGQPDGFQHPGPNLCVTEGSTVTITLLNTLPDDDVSIIFPGQTDVQVTGGIAAPNSLAQAAEAGGGAVTYSFIANKAAPTCRSRCKWACSDRWWCAPALAQTSSTTAPPPSSTRTTNT